MRGSAIQTRRQIRHKTSILPFLVCITVHIPPTVSIEPFGLCSKYSCPKGRSIVRSSGFLFSGGCSIWELEEERGCLCGFILLVEAEEEERKEEARKAEEARKEEEARKAEEAKKEEDKIGVTWYRWVVLAIFSLQNFVNSIEWICFAPIQTTITEYYGISTTKANLLSTMFLICSLPSTPAAMYLQERFGLRVMVFVGAIFQAVGGWIRYGGQDRDQFAVVLAGSIIAGPSMAVFMCLPSKLAASWFPKTERTIATTIASLAGVVGVLAGYVIGPAIIKTPSDVPTFLLVQAIIPSAAAVTVFLFRQSPPMAASLSETVEKIPLRTALQVAFANKSFVLVLMGFTFGLGCFNAVSTLIDQVVHPLGYSEDDSSLFGGLLIGLGLVGAAILGTFVEKTHKYKTAMMISIWGCAGCTLWAILALQPDNKASLTASFAFIGIFGLTLLPLTLECGCELIFPVPEVVTNGLLMVFGQTFGVVIVYVMDAMKEKGTGDMTNAMWLLFGFVVLSGICLSSFYPAYKRFKHDSNASLPSPSSTSSTFSTSSTSSTTPFSASTTLELDDSPPPRWWRFGY
eukprot:Phypoly_transcript_03868.p1 GENE.Phypoly_transcript_03868~~Phypoly_transcript_03868.p1  ORF type:complete len:573 (+),score=108.65 Phypoly_transcript_03868:219-1937(+)